MRFLGKKVVIDHKSGRFASQFLSFLTAIRQCSYCKTIGIALQNDRFCMARPKILLHTFTRTRRKHRVISPLWLHTHTVKISH